MFFLHIRVTLMSPDLSVFHNVKSSVIGVWRALTEDVFYRDGVDCLFRLEYLDGEYVASAFLPTEEAHWFLMKKVVAAVRSRVWGKFECTEVARGLSAISAVRNTWCPSEYRVARYFVKIGAFEFLCPCLHECT